MKMEQILEGNRLIAEFDGIKKGNPNSPDDPRWTDRYFNKHGSCIGKNPPYYNSDWDLLMPVIGKIVRDERFIETEYREHLMDIVPYAHIEDVYEAVIGFIKWYNEIDY